MTSDFYSGMKAKHRGIYICEAAPGHVFKLMQCLRDAKNRLEITQAHVREPGSKDSPQDITRDVIEVFQAAGYRREPVILGLASSYAASRFLKIPTQDPAEIPKIISLQASAYLPYAAGELVTGYQVVSAGEDGYADIHIVMVPRSVLDPYLEAFKKLKPASLHIHLSAYGIAHCFEALRPEQKECVMVMDRDTDRVEMAVLENHKVLVNHFAQLSEIRESAERFFIDELGKIQKLIREEVGASRAVKKIYIFSTELPAAPSWPGGIDGAGQSVETLSARDLPFHCKDRDALERLGRSFIPLMGFGLKNTDETLNLVPEETRHGIQKKRMVRAMAWRAVAFAAVFMVFGLATIRNMDDKMMRLEQIRSELTALESEGHVLTALEKRLRWQEKRIRGKGLIADLLYEIHHLAPASLFLSRLEVEEEKETVIAGQAQDLNAVLNFVAQLEKSAVFKNHAIKIRYATRRATPAGDVTDFEIACSNPLSRIPPRHVGVDE